MKSNILIIGDEKDPHIISVCKHLQAENADFVVLNPSNGEKGNITFNFNPIKITFKNEELTLEKDQIHSVWWRMKPNLNKYPKTLAEFETLNFITREWQLALESLSYFLIDCFWINKRSSDLLVRNKPYQLYLASKYGFQIPNTVISNSFIEIQRSIEKFNSTIYKPLGYFIVPPDKVLYSNRMTKDQISKKEANVKIAPCIFQDYVDKDYELRITIIGNQIYAVKIFSQESEKSKFDWRRDQLNIKYESIQINTLFEDKLLKLHNAFDLYFGAYDFIVDKNGQEIFLEVNPVGQWLWLERNLNLDVSRQTALSLINKNLHPTMASLPTTR